MKDTARLLHIAISTVCPLYGVSIGNPSDKKTWRIDFAPEATAEQQDAARAALATFNPDAPDPVVPSIDFFNRFTGDEQAAIYAFSARDPRIGAGIVNGLAGGTVSLAGDTARGWVTILVNGGVLARARGDEVLKP